MPPEIVTTEHSDVGSVRTVLLPSWVQHIRVVVRKDNDDKITFTITRMYPTELWVAMLMAGDPTTVCALQVRREGPPRIGRTQVTVDVSVPAFLGKVITIKPSQPGE